MKNESFELPPQNILDLLDDFTRAREALVQGLKKLGFSDEQAYAKIMRHQTETQQMYRSFKENPDFHEATYDWQGRKKFAVTHKDLDTQA
tara:strand:- start:211 stop:480 length:270 start_codon:yes stop_codon:yes gene_type:complete